MNHSKGFVDKEDKTVHTQNIELTWRLAKHRNKLQCGTYRPQLDNYLFEFMYRRLHGGCDDIFLQIMKDLVEFAPPNDVHQRQEVMEEGNPNDEEEVMEEGSVNDEAGGPPPLEPNDEAGGPPPVEPNDEAGGPPPLEPNDEAGGLFEEDVLAGVDPLE